MPDLILPAGLKRGDAIRGLLKDLPATGTVLRVDLAGNPEWVAATVLDYGARAGFASFEFVNLGDGGFVESDRERIKKRARNLGVAVDFREGSLQDVDPEGIGRPEAVGGSLADELERLHQMRERGILTEDEFTAAKRSVMSATASSPTTSESSPVPTVAKHRSATAEKKPGGIGCGTVALVLVVLVAVTQCDLGRDTSPANVQPRSTTSTTSAAFEIPQIFQNISNWAPTETDCSTLQQWFDGAANAHGNQSQLDAMRWFTDLMRRIDDRMRSVGCYG